MPESPFVEDDYGDLWIRMGEFYTQNRDALCDALGCMAIWHTEADVLALVAGKGWVPAGDLAKVIGKPKISAVP